MLIENPDSLRVWLVSVLSPLCEADPEALAKYVMALIKKDKSEDDLKRNCLEQLEVFLQNHTQEFVNKFFDSVKSKSYLKPVEPSSSSSSSSSKQTSTSGTQSSSSATRTTSGTLTTSQTTVTSTSESTIETPTQSSSSNDRKKDDKRRSRSRSPVKARSPRPRSPGRRREPWGDSKDLNRDRDGRHNRNHWSEGKSRTDRRSKRSSRSRSRSPGRGRERARSRTPEKVTESKNKRKERSPSPDDRHKKKDRCRDFEEQGFCLKGDLCPFDHGNDPVVLDGIPFPNGASAPIPPPQQPLLPTPGHTWPTEPYNPEAPAMNSRPPPGMLIPPPGIMGPPPFNNPWNAPPPIPGQMPQRFINPGHTRVLSNIIPVSDVGGQPDIQPPQFHGRPPGRGRMFQGFRGHSHHHRRGGMQRKMQDPETRTLEVRKIPYELNTISKLNEYFSQFGEVTQINVCYEGDREAALITFAGHNQAMTAIRSPDAILGNRFVKVFWHSKERQEQEPPRPEEQESGEEESVPTSPGGTVQRKVETKGNRPNVRDRLGFQVPIEDVQVTVQTRPAPSQPVQDPKLLRKTNVKKEVAPIKLPAEINKERYTNMLEIKKKKTNVLNSIHEQRTLVKKKYENAKNKTEQIKYLVMFEKLDCKYKKYEEELRRIEEDLSMLSAAFFGVRGRGRGGRGPKGFSQSGRLVPKLESEQLEEKVQQVVVEQTESSFEASE